MQLYRSQKIVLILLSFLLLTYLGFEVWFVTAFINSSTLNTDLSRLNNLENYAISLAVFSITVNFLIFVVKIYNFVRGDLIKYSSVLCALLTLVLIAVTSGRVLTLAGGKFVIVVMIISGILLLLKKSRVNEVVANTVALVIVVVVFAFVTGVSIAYFKDAMYKSDPDDAIMCHIASEFYKGRHYSPWNQQDEFIAIEQYQLDSITFSINTCQSEERRALIANDPELRAHMAELFRKEFYVESVVRKYSEVRSRMNDAFRIHKAYRDNPNDKTIFYVVKELQGQGYSDDEIIRFLSMIGFEVKIAGWRSQLNVQAILKTDQQVFDYVVSKMMGSVGRKPNLPAKVPFMASESTFENVMFTQPFEKKYTEFQDSKDFSHLVMSSNLRKRASREYLKGAPKELVLNLSIITTVLSAFSMVLMYIELALGGRPNVAVKILLSPFLWATVVLCGLYSLLPAPTSGSAARASLINVHYYTYPFLRRQLDSIGVVTWINTYRDKPDIQELEAGLNESMVAKYYLTPVAKSAVKQIVLLRYVNRFYGLEKTYETELTDIENFYKSIDATERYEYVLSVRESFRLGN